MLFLQPGTGSAPPSSIGSAERGSGSGSSFSFPPSFVLAKSGLLVATLKTATDSTTNENLNDACYLFLASINVKSPLSSSEYISNPCSFKESLNLNSLVLSDFVVSTIKRYPFFARLLLASIM
jgi:hypothetical protein